MYGGVGEAGREISPYPDRADPQRQRRDRGAVLQQGYSAAHWLRELSITTDGISAMPQSSATIDTIASLPATVA